VIEFLKHRDWRVAELIRWAMVFIVLMDVFLIIGDRLIMTGDADSGRGAHYEDRLSDGSTVILRRSRGGMPTGFCGVPSDGDYRVLFLGDSYTEGSGRGDDCNYPNVVEDVLRTHWHPQARVINAGVTAYGPHEAVNLLKWYREKGCQVDAIVYNLFLENDFTDNLPETERRVVAGVVFRFPKSVFLRTFHPLNTRVFRWALYFTYVSRMSAGAKEAASLAAGECDPDPETLESVTPFLENLIERRLEGSNRVASSDLAQAEALTSVSAMRDEARALGIPFFVVVFPDRVLVDPELQGHMGIDDSRLKAPKEIESRVRTTFFDIPVIEASNELTARVGMYRRSDTHLSDLGNQVAGQYVGQELAERLSALK